MIQFVRLSYLIVFSHFAQYVAQCTVAAAIAFDRQIRILIVSHNSAARFRSVRFLIRSDSQDYLRYTPEIISDFVLIEGSLPKTDVTFAVQSLSSLLQFFVHTYT